VVYLLTKAPVIVTTMCIFAVHGMHGHLALTYPHALELGHAEI